MTFCQKAVILGCLLLPGMLSAYPAGADEEELRNKIVETAKQFLGVPYIYGAESPAGFDCSGFVRYVYRTAAGITVPKSSQSIWDTGKSVEPGAARPGDIMVFNTVGNAASHVGILLEGGSLIHAVSSGPRTGVIISSLEDRYFGPRILGVRSFIDGEARPDAPAAEPIGFTITNHAETYRDTIPAAQGRGLQFVIRNGTGRDGIFEILFFKMDINPFKNQTIRQDRIGIGADQSVELEPLFLAEPGRYKLILKTSGNIKRVERIWEVIPVAEH
ncbi:MAG: C40 family peptidase [Treponema sp.]|jgi:hypothetical protein|nr:C40 family peptidase [Treponema sp.]